MAVISTNVSSSKQFVAESDCVVTITGCSERSGYGVTLNNLSIFISTDSSSFQLSGIVLKKGDTIKAGSYISIHIGGFTL